MFGHRWQPAEGKLVDVRTSHFGPGDNSAVVRHFLFDVTPSDGEPFRTEVREPLMTSGAFDAPSVIGQAVHLECDPKRQKARFHGDPEQLMADNVRALQAEGERLEAQERREEGAAGA
jgi:hypothetical protein